MDSPNSDKNIILTSNPDFQSINTPNQIFYQNPNNIPDNNNLTPNYSDIDFKSIQNISQVSPKNIRQIEQNIFLFKTHSSLIYIFAINGIIFMGAFFIILFTQDTNDANNIIFASVFLIVGLILFLIFLKQCFLTDYLILLELGYDNKLKIIRQSRHCRKKVTIYQKDELNKFEFKIEKVQYHYHRSNQTGYYFHYNCFLILKNGKIDEIYKRRNQGEIFTEIEIKYLEYIINNFINTN